MGVNFHIRKKTIPGEGGSEGGMVKDHKNRFFFQHPSLISIRVAKCRGYDGYIRVKIFAGWGKKSGRTGILAKLSLSWEGFAQLM